MMTTTTTTEPTRTARRRPRISGAVAFVLVLIAGACTSGQQDQQSDTPATITTSGGSTSGDPSSQTAATASPGTTATTAPADPAATLADALALFGTGYSFTSEALVNGERALGVEGIWLSGDSQLTITSGDGTVDYLLIGDQQWARAADGDWAELDAPGPAGNPLAALANPTALEIIDASPQSVRMQATYPGSDFSLGTPEVNVVLVFTGGLLSEASYVVETDGATAETRTIFEELADPTPITAPGA